MHSTSADPMDPRYLWNSRIPLHLTTLHGGSMLSGSARADTPFGPLAGRTMIHVSDAGEDSAVISFQCGTTPVMLAVAGDNYLGLVRELIAHASTMNRGRLEDELDAALEVAS